MNVLAWLRKLGHASHALGVREPPIDVDGLSGLTAAQLEERGLSSVGSRHFLTNAIAVPKERAEQGGRSDASPARKLRRPGSTLGNGPSSRELTLVRQFPEAPTRAQPTPFVGREAELRLLLRAWRRAEGGQGQVVLLSGEAGIGKSHRARAVPATERPPPHRALAPLLARARAQPVPSDHRAAPADRRAEPGGQVRHAAPGGAWHRPIRRTGRLDRRRS